MLLLKTAFKNILGGGKRTWLNVAVLSFTFVLIIGYNATIDGWLQDARRNTIEWETGAGEFWHSGYDRYDVFTLQDAHGPIPKDFQPYLDDGTLTPVLVTQGVIYPQGRMQNVLLKGIDTNQKILYIPSKELNHANEITAVIGKRTAESAKLKEGDRVMVRWRDRNGAFDAQEILITGVFDTKVPAVDAGQLWLSLDNLQRMTGMPGEATYLVKSEQCPLQSDTDDWLFKDLKFLMYDLDLMKQGSRVESAIIFSILLAIALLAVFDTQTLAIFRRQKEIGTYIALGMTPQRVTRLFTLEGTSFSILAIIVSVIWGVPFMLWYNKVGFKMPDMKIDAVLGDVLYPAFEFSSIFTSIALLIALSAVISYLPTRKIAKQNVVDALKGKIN